MEELRPQTTLFCAVVALAIAVRMLLRGRRPVQWLFAAFAADISFWYASQSFYGLFQAPIWVRVTGLLTVLLPQFAVHLFHAIVPSERGVWREPLTKIAGMASIPILVLVLSPYQQAPPSLGLIYLYVFGIIAIGLLQLAQRGRQSRSRAVRERVRFLFVVGVLAMTFTLADFLSFLGVRLPPIGAVLATVFIFVLGESLTRQRLVDLYEMAGRLSVATALAFCLAGIFYLFVSVLGRFNTMYLNAVLTAIVFLVLFEPLQDEVETRIHQFFFRERRALETAAAELHRHLAHVLVIDEMVEILLEGLESSRRVTSCAIFLRDQDGNGFDLAGSFGSVAPARIEALAARPLLERLLARPSVSLEDLARKADASLVTAATALGPLQGAVLLGVKEEGNGLLGFIAVADERVRDAFTPEEVSLLETLAVQIGVAVANSRIYSRMKERDRLAALGAMAAGLAHEVKNPLGAIKGSAQLLEELTYPASVEPSAIDFIGIILEEVERLDRVVGSFLDYARPHAGNPVPIDINAAVRRTVQILTSQQTEEVSIKLDLAEPIPHAKIDPEKFRQVMINLVQNAFQAMDHRGCVTISTAARRVGIAPWSGSPTGERSNVVRAEDTSYVEISVRDTGPGISQKVFKNLFIPFFTTKEEGTGLGLAISQSIVQNAGGTIHAQSQSGAGTTFTIVLPSAQDEMQKSANLVKSVRPT